MFIYFTIGEEEGGRELEDAGLMSHEFGGGVVVAGAVLLQLLDQSELFNAYDLSSRVALRTCSEREHETFPSFAESAGYRVRGPPAETSAPPTSVLEDSARTSLALLTQLWRQARALHSTWAARVSHLLGYDELESEDLRNIYLEPRVDGL